MNTISQSLAAFALGRLDLPSDVLAKAQDHFLDTLGVAVASSGFPFAASVNAAADSLGKGSDATVIGTGRTLPANLAAMVNGTLAHGLDFDDTHIEAIYHASATAMATVLAVGEETGASGREILEAFIVALEIGCRLALTAKGEFHDKHLHPTAICGPFAAAAAAARLYGLNETQLADALGLCGSLAGGILQFEGAWLKRLHPGWAAHSGITAAALGRAGFTGPKTVFEGPHGYFMAHLGYLPDTERLIHGLNDEWVLRGLAIKPYPCCHFIHAFADAALELVAARGAPFTADEIIAIEAPLSERLHHLVWEPRASKIEPQSEYDALFSTPYVIGLALARGRVDLSGFFDGNLADPEVVGISRKVTCTVDQLSDFPVHFPGELRITLLDGSRHVLRRPQSRGTPGLPLERAEILAKFRANVLRELSPAAAERLQTLALGLCDLESIAPLLSATRANVEEVAA